eukprot:11002359-Alexandrium_andersonii.AAC.1
MPTRARMGRGGHVTSSHMGHGTVVMEKADCVQEWKQLTVQGCAEEVEVVAKSAGWMVRQMNRIGYVRDGVRIARSSCSSAWDKSILQAWEAARRHDQGQLLPAVDVVRKG